MFGLRLSKWIIVQPTFTRTEWSMLMVLTKQCTEVLPVDTWVNDLGSTDVGTMLMDTLIGELVGAQWRTPLMTPAIIRCSSDLLFPSAILGSGFLMNLRLVGLLLPCGRNASALW